MDQTNIETKQTGSQLSATEFNTVNSKINELVEFANDTAETLENFSEHDHATVYEPLKSTDDNYVTDAEKTKLSNLSGINTGDQDANDFDIKDLADITSLRSTWSGKQNALPTSATTFLGLVSVLGSTVTIGTAETPSKFLFKGAVYSEEITVDISGESVIGYGTSNLIDLSRSDKYRFINADEDLTINNVSNSLNGALFILVVVAAADITISFSSEWGDITQPVLLTSGNTLMVSGYITGGSIIAAHNSSSVATIDAPILDTFTLGSSETSTSQTVAVTVTTSGGNYTDYKLSENDLSLESWVSGTIPSTFTLSNTNELKTVNLQVKNSGGESLEVSDTITLAIPVPVISDITLGDGSGNSETALIDLTITASNTPTHYRAKHVTTGSSAPDLTLEAWIAISGSLTYTLPDEGTYDVYVMVRNNGNVNSNAYYETIEIAYPVNVPIVSISQPATVCQDSTISLTATADVYTSLLWTTAGDGTFSSTTSLTPTYTPGAADIIAGSATLTLTATNDGEEGSDSVTASIQKQPTVNAGVDQEIEDTETVTLVATVANYSSLLWTTDGDGTFSTTTAASSVYTPGTTDKSSGSVILTLTAQAISPCGTEASDSLTVTITEVASDPITIQINHGATTALSGWNSMKELRTTEADYLISDAVDENGTTTGISVTKSLAIQNILNSGGSTSLTYAATSGGPNQIIDSVPAALCVNYMRVTRDVDYAAIQFSNLNPAKQYKFRVLCSNSLAGAYINMAVVQNAATVTQVSDMTKFIDALAITGNVTPSESTAFYPHTDGTVLLVAWRGVTGVDGAWNWTKLIEV